MKIKDFIKERDGIYILEKVLNKDKTWIYLNDNIEVPKEAIEILEKVKKGYPIEYIFEEVWFYGDKFYIKEGVLIPRDDTEVVVERAIKLINGKCKMENGCRVVDCCTGSGVIAIEVAKHTNSKVLATDISDTAIEVARKNIMLSGVQEKVKVVKADLLDVRGLRDSDLISVKSRASQEKIEQNDILQYNDIEENIKNFGFEIEKGLIKGDILLSNPPYVENSWKKPNVYEPDIAFFGGDDGLDIVRKLINYAIALKYKALVLEIGYNQKKSLSEYLEGKVKSFEFFEDLAGNIRGVEIIV
ncbi:N5-glutamine methyltransferase family protein [Caminibacter pacificus]|uniref:Peptide chain release factor N(5)-glutamine methyltransferase n=1 Tax=Caminibacter pacificus TaxID=1424653 RepID=A0AAJ4REJ3_9BACT|nr:HemK/PrmC family methyltransferase [Caminibacter pacificus]QCI28142.1 peptide chain release factor N(5)-glutamine methyltransferase [Caminibacter pacificus]ROR41146.1 release factor glutamine methyltransferase [Caminibacter pacificus]